MPHTDPLFFGLRDDELDALLVSRPASFLVLGDSRQYFKLLGSVFHYLVDPAIWPDDLTRAHWEEQVGPRSLRISGVGMSAYKAALSAGFEPEPDEQGRQGAYYFYIKGRPRFESWVLHPCRIAHGQELYDLMRQGIEYDETGEYTRQCLENGPSFVCEVDGEPVCWSCTHLGGTMGMIYTPPRYRRKGYARSLAAFQTDYMLARDGIACCQVMELNEASREMMESMGARRLPEPSRWRTVYWPE
jgi:GNAT superfamily N-acetyltransferase